MRADVVERGVAQQKELQVVDVGGSLFRRCHQRRDALVDLAAQLLPPVVDDGDGVGLEVPAVGQRASAAKDTAFAADVDGGAAGVAAQDGAEADGGDDGCVCVGVLAQPHTGADDEALLRSQRQRGDDDEPDHGSSEDVVVVGDFVVASNADVVGVGVTFA